MPDLEADQPQPPLPPAAGHVPVLPREVLALLDPQPGEIFLDCTVGRAGHSLLLAPRLAPGGRILALDVDPQNVEYARQMLAHAAVPVEVIHANFAHALPLLHARQLAGDPAKPLPGAGRVNLLLADLGFASNQMSDATRGFSFNAQGPLDMRLDPTLELTAADLVNTLPERELADLIYQFGEERLSRRIARKITEIRHRSPIHTTSELARIVRAAYGRRGGDRIDPATRTFMALRIAVNRELDALEQLLGQLPLLLAPGARVALISFHSLEDRLVKRSFLAYRQQQRAQVLTTKPVIAADDERDANSRSRSAKLRALRWIA